MARTQTSSLERLEEIPSPHWPTGLGHRIVGRTPGIHRKTGIGWEHLHIAIDDYSRVEYVELLPDDRALTVGRLSVARCGGFERVASGYGACCPTMGSGCRSASFRATCRALHVAHRRTRPYTPRINGKAERFIQSAEPR